jgi:hypothetical protein
MLFSPKEKGQGLVEYALILVLIAIVRPVPQRSLVAFEDRPAYFFHRIDPSTNLFAWSLPPMLPFTYGAWLGEYLLYLVYQLGRLPLLIFTNTLLLVLAFALVGLKPAAGGLLAAGGVVLILAAGMSFNNTALRPQIWAFLPFMAFLILLGAYTDRQVQPSLAIAAPG